MVRDTDVSGVSGTGPVAQVVEFDSGEVAVSFYLHTANVPNVIVYHSLEDCDKIHGHGGYTRLIEVKALDPDDWLDAARNWRPA